MYHWILVFTQGCALSRSSICVYWLELNIINREGKAHRENCDVTNYAEGPSLREGVSSSPGYIFTFSQQIFHVVQGGLLTSPWIVLSLKDVYCGIVYKNDNQTSISRRKLLCDDIMENEVALKKEQHKSVCSNRGGDLWYSTDFQKTSCISISIICSHLKKQPYTDMWVLTKGLKGCTSECLWEDGKVFYIFTSYTSELFLIQTSFWMCFRKIVLLLL